MKLDQKSLCVKRETNRNEGFMERVLHANSLERISALNQPMSSVERELKECTFKPVTNPKKKKKRRKNDLSLVSRRLDSTMVATQRPIKL